MIRTIRHKYSVSDEHFEKMWKLIPKQSERQLGAFAMLFYWPLRPFKRKPILSENAEHMIHQVPTFTRNVSLHR